MGRIGWVAYGRRRSKPSTPQFSWSDKDGTIKRDKIAHRDRCEHSVVVRLLSFEKPRQQPVRKSVRTADSQRRDRLLWINLSDMFERDLKGLGGLPSLGLGS